MTLNKCFNVLVALLLCLMAGVHPARAEANQAAPVPALASSLTFKVMVSTYSAAGLIRASGAQMTIRSGGSIYNQATSDGNGFLEFAIPTAAASNWRLEVDGLAARRLSARIIDGFLHIYDSDSNDLEIWYFENLEGDGSYAFEYYKNTIYICNQAGPGAPILSRLSTPNPAEPLPDHWVVRTLDSQNDVGLYTSIALDAQGKPHISYFDNTNGGLRYYNGRTGQARTVSDRIGVGLYTSLALDTNGKPHISFYNTNRGTLRYYNGATNTRSALDTNKNVGQDTSIAIDANGKIHVSHYDQRNGSLKYYSGVTDTSVALDSTGRVGLYTSIALDGDGKPHISYFDKTNGTLKYYNGATTAISTLDSTGRVGLYTSIALDRWGKPHISYYDITNGRLKYYNGEEAKAYVLDRRGRTGQDTSIALDRRGNPHISFYDITNGNLVYYNGADGSRKVVDRAGDVGSYTSIALDDLGRAHISYYDTTNGDLKYAVGPEPAGMLGGTQNHFGGGRKLIPGTGGDKATDGVNSSRTTGQAATLTRALPYSVGSDGNSPGLTIRWIYADGAVQSWAAPLVGSTMLSRGSTLTTTTLVNKGVPYVQLAINLSSRFTAGLATGRHTLVYWLWDQQGNKSNARWEYVEVN